jgi:hypothetical protein
MILFLTCLQISSCKEQNQAIAPVNNETAKTAVLENIPGTTLHRVKLTQEAAKRIGLQILPIGQTQIKGAAQKTVPYSALIYDPQGASWIYTSIDPLTFVRTSIDVNSIEADQVAFFNGPPVGTNVVSVGATELYGIEFLGNIQP